VDKDSSIYVEKEELKQEMDKWVFPYISSISRQARLLYPSAAENLMSKWFSIFAS
jgi:hypothetical protein